MGHIKELSRTPCAELLDADGDLSPIFTDDDDDLGGMTNFLRGGSRGGLTDPP